MTYRPGEIAIIGAGPTGLDAALAAAEADIPFTVYEAGPEVGSAIRSWGHVRLFTPWSMNLSERSRRALKESGAGLPDPDVCPTGEDLVNQYLLPIAKQESLWPHLSRGTTVVQIGREGQVKSDAIGTAARGRTPFRLLLRDAAGKESVANADFVLDCSGSSAVPNALGSGGIPAPGEAAAHEMIDRRIPNFDDEGVVARLAGKRLLLVGAGHSAQTAACGLAALMQRAPGTHVTWLVRSVNPDFAPLPDDPLRARAELARTSARFTVDPDSPFEFRKGRAIQSLEPLESGVRVMLVGGDSLEVDRILALTGSVGDRTLYSQLQVHECWATQGPMKLAAALLASSSSDCLAQETHGADTLRNPEPGFFILGSKSYGRNTTFLLRVGYEQVDEVFSLIKSRFGAASGAA